MCKKANCGHKSSFDQKSTQVKSESQQSKFTCDVVTPKRKNICIFHSRHAFVVITLWELDPKCLNELSQSL